MDYLQYHRMRERIVAVPSLTSSATLLSTAIPEPLRRAIISNRNSIGCRSCGWRLWSWSQRQRGTFGTEANVQSLHTEQHCGDVHVISVQPPLYTKPARWPWCCKADRGRRGWICRECSMWDLQGQGWRRRRGGLWQGLYSKKA